MQGQGAQNLLVVGSTDALRIPLAPPYVLSRQHADPGPRFSVTVPPAGRTPPTFVEENESAWNVSTEPRTVNVDVLDGDLIVVCAVSADWADSTDTFSTPTGGGLTYQQVEQVTLSLHCGAGIWVAEATADANFDVSIELSGSPDALFGMNVLIYRDHGGIGNSVAATDELAAPSTALTTSTPNSAIVAVVGDWNAADGASRDWEAINGFDPDPSGVANNYEKTYFRQSGEYTVYIGTWPDSGASGLKVVGLSAPSSTQYALAAVEILGLEETGGGGAVELDGDAENAASASGAVEVDRPLTTSANAASSGTGSASVERPIEGSGSAANSASASLSRTRDVAASAPVAASANASTFARAAGLTSHADAASDADASAEIARALAGSAPASSVGTASADVSRALSASANAASGASADLSIQGQVTLAGSAPAAAVASAALSKSVPLTGLGAVASGASAELSVRDTTPSLDASASAAALALSSTFSIARGLSTVAAVASSATAEMDVLGAYEPALVGVDSTASVTQRTAVSVASSARTDGTARASERRTDGAGSSIVDSRASVSGSIG